MLENWWNWTAGKYLKLVAPQWPTDEFPKFVAKAKNEATWKYELTDESYTKVSWTVESMKTTHNWKEGQAEVKGWSAKLVDWEEVYYLDATMSNASKDLANHLLGNIWSKVNISLYINNNKYPASSVKTDDGEFAPTSLSFKWLDKNELYDKIKGQEPVSEDSIPF